MQVGRRARTRAGQRTAIGHGPTTRTRKCCAQDISLVAPVPDSAHASGYPQFFVMTVGVGVGVDVAAPRRPVPSAPGRAA